MSTYAPRKQRIYDDLTRLEARLNAAKPDSLPWQFWNEILEVVEKLPAREQQAWKDANIVRLRRAVRGVDIDERITRDQSHPAASTNQDHSAAGSEPGATRVR